MLGSFIFETFKRVFEDMNANARFEKDHGVHSLELVRMTQKG